MPGWFRQIFAKPEPTPVESIRISAKKRHSACLLYTSGDELCDFVTEVFLQHGAPAEIALKQKPLVGTDQLRGVITSIRKEIESLGGEVHFNTCLLYTSRCV